VRTVRRLLLKGFDGLCERFNIPPTNELALSLSPATLLCHLRLAVAMLRTKARNLQFHLKAMLLRFLQLHRKKMSLLFPCIVAVA